jgi:hypothetical protein
MKELVLAIVIINDYFNETELTTLRQFNKYINQLCNKSYNRLDIKNYKYPYDEYHRIKMNIDFGSNLIFKIPNDCHIDNIKFHIILNLPNLDIYNLKYRCVLLSQYDLLNIIPHTFSDFAFPPTSEYFKFKYYHNNLEFIFDCPYSNSYSTYHSSFYYCFNIKNFQIASKLYFLRFDNNNESQISHDILKDLYIKQFHIYCKYK